MAVIATALADLRYGLIFAADRYRTYALGEDPAGNATLLLELANERERDVDNLDGAAGDSEVHMGETTLDDASAGQMLSLGRNEPYSASSTVYRIQRAENMLERLAAQLSSLTPDILLRDTLNGIRTNIAGRRDDLRAARRRAQNRELSLNFTPTVISRNDQGRAIEGQEVAVWFGTNRQRSFRGKFVGERAKVTSFGRCHVLVPEDRSIGSLGRGLFRRIIDGDNRVKILGTDILGEQQFWRLLTNEMAALPDCDRHGLVFLHGYNTSFDDAARRTAQLKVDLAHKGPAGFFAWPSLGHKAGYAGDEAAIEGSETPIRKFLVDFAESSGASAVHIIAHSMGNRALLRAMAAIAGAAITSTSVRFGQIFLAAPDVDTQLFENLALAYGRLSKRTTLYVTSNDIAIGLSRRLHRFARVGLTPPVAIVHGIDTVDASHVNLGWWGHRYATEMRPVLTDIHCLIQGDTAPDHRFGLRKALGGKANYWEFIR